MENPNNEELLTEEERADVLNAINDVLEKFGLEVASYEDLDGIFFNVQIWRNGEGKAGQKCSVCKYQDFDYYCDHCMRNYDDKFEEVKDDDKRRSKENID